MQKDAIEIFSIYAQIFFWISSYFYIEIFKNQTSDLYCIITSTFIIKNTPISSRSVFMADFIGFPLNTWIFSLCCRNYSLLCVIWGSCPHAVCWERNMPGCLADWLPECPVVRGPRPWSPPLLVMCVRKVVTHIWQKSQVPHAARLQVVLHPLSAVLGACAMTVIALFFAALLVPLWLPLLGLRASLDPPAA